MCDNHKPFELIDDDLDDVFGPLPEGHVVPEISDEQHAVALNSLSNGNKELPKGEQTYEEDCPKCKGSGRFVGYTGRVIGNCFNCKGSGKVTFKTSPEARAKSQTRRDEVAARKQKEIADKAGKWFGEHDAELKWMVAAGARGFDFGQSMFNAVIEYGSLTDKQLAAVHRCMAQDAERENERAEIAERAPDIDEKALDKLHAAFTKALDKNVAYPKMRLDTYLFSLVRSGANEGAIYVKSIAKGDDGERTYLGKIVDGRFLRAFNCTDEDEERIVAAACDPEAAAIAYGRREGACSICARKLTNHASIDAGIGPICAENFGW